MTSLAEVLEDSALFEPDAPSLFSHIQAHLDPESGVLLEEGWQLPDGPQCTRKAVNAELALTLFERLKALIETPSEDALTHFYALFAHELAVLDLIDTLMDHIRGHYFTEEADQLRLFDLYLLGYWLASSAPHREPVKLGISLLALFQDEDAMHIMKILGLHDEFTLFTAVGMINSIEHPSQELWHLAMRVGGWGRIHLVERLADTQSDEIKAWMLREGYKNRVKPEHLAYVCAETGGLLSALKETHPDEALLEGAGDLLSALIRGGPNPGIEEYADGKEAIALYLQHVKRTGFKPSSPSNLEKIRNYSLS